MYVCPATDTIVCPVCIHTDMCVIERFLMHVDAISCCLMLTNCRQFVSGQFPKNHLIVILKPAVPLWPHRVTCILNFWPISSLAIICTLRWPALLPIDSCKCLL